MKFWFWDSFHRGSLVVSLITCALVVHISVYCRHTTIQIGNDPQNPSASVSKQTVKSQKAKLFFFTAVWCVPCKEVKRFLDKLSKKYNDSFDFIVIDYDKFSLEVDDFQVKLLPTIILLDSDNKLLIRVNGATREGLEALELEVKALSSKKLIDKEKDEGKRR